MRTLMPLAALLSMALAACGTGSGMIGISTSGGGNDTTSSFQVTVRIENFAFNPSSVNLQRGGVVTWVWPTDTVSHNVTFADAAISSPTQRVGTHTVVFTDQGTFTYRCTIHTGMTGSVVVR